MNEFVARNGLIALDSSSISGPLTVSGRLGIGTTTPSYSLDVNGIARVGASGASGQLYIKGFAGSGQYIYLDDGSTVWSVIGGSAYNIQKDGNNVFTINASSNVGIGTTSPTYKLHVSGGILSSGPAADMYVNSTSATSLISINGADTSTNIIGTQILSDTIVRWRLGMVAGRKFYIQPANGAGSFTTTPAITILSGSGNVGINNTNPAQALDVTGNIIASGDVGIGTTSPTSKLHVSGSALITGDLTVRGTYLILGGPLSVNSIRSVGTLNRETLQYIAGPIPSDTNLADHTFGNGQGDIAITSGTRSLVSIARGFNPSSGTGVYNFLSITGTVSQSNATGISRGIHIAPTITNAADYRAVQWDNNTNWGLYGNGSAASYLGGDLRVNETNASNAMIFASTTGKTNVVGMRVGGSGTQAVSMGFFSNQTLNSANNSEYFSFNSNTDISSGTYSITSVTSYQASIGAKPAGVTIGTLYGFYANSNLIAGNTNYGFYGNIPASSSRWNLYMAGTANNYLAGNLGLGVTSPISRLHVDLVNNQYAYFGGNDQTAGVMRGIRFGYGSTGPNYWKSAIIQEQTGDAAARGKIHILNNNQFGSDNASLSDARITILASGEVGINNQSPTYRLDISGSFRASGSITATSGSDYFDISHDITQPAQTGSQVYEVNITPTLRYTAPNQTQTALRVAATFSGSTALSSSQSNIIADFGSTSAGSQLVVNDITSGSIYMVNDVSGIPIIEANSNWDVFIYDYPNVVLKKTGSAIEISGSLTIASGSNNDLYMYGHKMFSVGAFQSDQTQSGSANVSQSITYNAIDYSQGVTLVSGSRLTVANAGVYNIQFSVQVDRTTGSGVDTIHIWLKKNGTNVTNSSGTITISGNASQAKTVSSWNYVVDSAANDYYELVWQTSNTAIQLINVAATGNIPGTPSVIVTVTQVR